MLTLLLLVPVLVLLLVLVLVLVLLLVLGGAPLWLRWRRRVLSCCPISREGAP